MDQSEKFYVDYLNEWGKSANHRTSDVSAMAYFKLLNLAHHFKLKTLAFSRNINRLPRPQLQQRHLENKFIIGLTPDESDDFIL